MSDPTTPATFHAALRSLLLEHQVENFRLGPRQTAEGMPADDIEGMQHASPLVKVTSITLYFLKPRDAQASGFFAALNGLPGVIPYPELQPHPLGGTQIWIRWLDGSDAVP